LRSIRKEVIVGTEEEEALKKKLGDG